MSPDSCINNDQWKWKWKKFTPLRIIRPAQNGHEYGSSFSHFRQLIRYHFSKDRALVETAWELETPDKVFYLLPRYYVVAANIHVGTSTKMVEQHRKDTRPSNFLRQLHVFGAFFPFPAHTKAQKALWTVSTRALQYFILLVIKITLLVKDRKKNLVAIPKKVSSLEALRQPLTWPRFRNRLTIVIPLVRVPFVSPGAEAENHPQPLS